MIESSTNEINWYTVVLENGALYGTSALSSTRHQARYIYLRTSSGLKLDEPKVQLKFSESFNDFFIEDMGIVQKEYTENLYMKNGIIENFISNRTLLMSNSNAYHVLSRLRTEGELYNETRYVLYNLFTDETEIWTPSDIHNGHLRRSHAPESEVIRCRTESAKTNSIVQIEKYNAKADKIIDDFKDKSEKLKAIIENATIYIDDTFRSVMKIEFDRGVIHLEDVNNSGYTKKVLISHL